MGIMRDYDINIIDPDKETFNLMMFYSKYVSKSLPLVLRNDAKSWPLYQLLTQSMLDDKLDQELNSLFTNHYGVDQKEIQPLI